MSEPFRKRWGLFPNPEVARTSAALDARQDCQRIVRLMGQYDMAWDMQRALELAWTSTQIELNELRITPTNAAVFQDLAEQLIFRGGSLAPPTAA
mgnify:CR=1 FL=1